MAGLSYAFDANAGETPQTVQQKRQLADALAARIFGRAPQNVGEGLNAIGQALIARTMGQDADAAQKAGQATIPSWLGGSAPSPSANIASAITGQPPAPSTPSVASAPMGNIAPPADTTGKIYSNDEPSPLDPPSGADRLAMAQTILGEAGNNPQERLGVASVIRNRAVDGGYGGDTPSQVVQAPNQFEPWNTAGGRQRMAAAAADPKQMAAADAAISAAYGEGGRAPEDPTEGKTMFYSPSAQAALGRPAPSWAQGPGQMIGKTAFYDDNSDLPQNAQPTQGTAPQNVPAAQSEQAATAPKNYGGPFANVSNEDLAKAAFNPWVKASNPVAAQALAAEIQRRATVDQQAADPLRNAQILKAQRDLQPIGAPYHDEDGNLVQKGPDGKVTVLSAADKAPTSVSEYKYYTDHFQPTAQQQQPMDYATFSTAKARAGATNISNNIDTSSAQSYDKQLAEGLGKSHAALANGVEDAQTRARDIAAMQGAVDAIQRNGGTTGGLAPAQRLELQKSINAGAAALGIAKPFSESDLSDKEFLTKFNRSMAGAQAKNAVGSRVTNFEMSNFLKANPGLDMTIAGNQRLLGIQAQIEQRNIAVGNAIRDATAEAIGNGKKIDPRTVQKIITTYDEQHHITDPATNQDLTQSYVLPEFQSKGTNPAQAQRHEQNMGKVRRYNPATGQIE